MKISEKKLGVLAYGDNNGYPFAHMFSGIKHIRNKADFTDDVGCLVFWGGTDIHSSLYKEKPNRYNQNRDVKPSVRDAIEWTLMRHAVERGVPTIGVCRGAQLQCAFTGGKLIQHVDNHHDNHVLHTSTSSNSAIVTNSCHHQMMLLNPVGVKDGSIELLAWSPGISSKYLGEDEVSLMDKLIKEPEVVHFKGINSIGIQGHPEWLDHKHPFVQYCFNVIEERLLTLETV